MFVLGGVHKKENNTVWVFMSRMRRLQLDKTSANMAIEKNLRENFNLAHQFIHTDLCNSIKELA